MNKLKNYLTLIKNNKKLNIIIGITLILLVFSIGAKAIDVTECSILDTDGATYNLINNVSGVGDCFFIPASNITFNGNGYKISLDGSGNGSGIFAVDVFNITIINIYSEGGLAGYFFQDITDSVFINLTANNNVYDGLYSANIINSTFYNTEVNNNPYAGLELNYNTGTVFYNINLSGINRKIYLSEVFDVNNSNIDWKTHFSVDGVNFTRQVLSFTQYNITYVDGTTGITAYYNISGLLPDTDYKVYNNSVNSYNLTTDSSGNLPEFSVSLSGETEISVIAEIPPTPTPTPVTPIPPGYNLTTNLTYMLENTVNQTLYAVPSNTSFLLVYPFNQDLIILLLAVIAFCNLFIVIYIIYKEAMRGI